MEITFYRKTTKMGQGKGFSIPFEIRTMIEDDQLYKITVEKIE